jgi:hypothetical protein
MSDGVLAHAIFPLLEVLSRGAVRPRGEDLLTGGVPCYGVYETADGRYMAVGALEEKFWNAVCDTLGRADLKAVHLATGEEGARARAPSPTYSGRGPRQSGLRCSTMSTVASHRSSRSRKVSRMHRYRREAW